MQAVLAKHMFGECLWPWPAADVIHHMKRYLTLLSVPSAQVFTLKASVQAGRASELFEAMARAASGPPMGPG